MRFELDDEGDTERLRIIRSLAEADLGIEAVGYPGIEHDALHVYFHLDEHNPEKLLFAFVLSPDVNDERCSWAYRCPRSTKDMQGALLSEFTMRWLERVTGLRPGVRARICDGA